MKDWIEGLPAEIMLCDTAGVIVEMNAAAAVLFVEDGGMDLLGANLLDCHPEPSRSMLRGMMQTQASHAYFNTEEGEKRFFFQSPWFKDGCYAGFVEFSFPVPDNIPNFIRG